MRRKKTGPKTGAIYNADEVKERAARGWITPRAAAELMNVRVDRVYRAIKAKHVRTAVSGDGEEVHRFYVHKADWVKLVNTWRTKLKRELGL